MELHFFTIPTLDSGPAQAELNRFLAGHRVTAVERQFVAQGVASHWAVCVSTAAGPAPLPAALKDGGDDRSLGKVDYKQVLNPADFNLFAELRSLRKQLAAEAGVPIYAVFTNEQLAAMVLQRVMTATALDAIEGVGAARVERYGPAFLGHLASAFGALP